MELTAAVGLVLGLWLNLVVSGYVPCYTGICCQCHSPISKACIAMCVFIREDEHWVDTKRSTWQAVYAAG